MNRQDLPAGRRLRRRLLQGTVPAACDPFPFGRFHTV